MNLPATFSQGQSYVHPVQDVREPTKPFEWADENAIFSTLVQTHAEEVTRCVRRRELRKQRISVKEMRDKDQILNDETVIPARTIDTNIRREKAPYVKYLEQSTSVLSFSDPNNPNFNYGPLQNWHTDLVRYGDWKLAHLFNIDSLLLHGTSYMEVVYDPSKPSFTDVEFVRRDYLLMPPGSKSIQGCTRVYRMFELTKSQFAQVSEKYGFDKEQVKKIKDRARSDEGLIKIFKGFMRDDQGTVNVAWRGDTTTCDNWLLAPAPLNLGIFAGLDETSKKPIAQKLKIYPIFDFPYHVEEDGVILDVQGRAALDLHVQDALTSLWSSTVNGAVRASRFYPTRKTAPGDTPRNQELFVLKHGHVFEGDFDVFQPAWPNAIAISAAQQLAVNKSQEMGSVDFAAMNRNDTAKTATELNYAREEADSLGGVNISLFSRSMLQVETLRWIILVSNLKLELDAGVPPDRLSRRLPPTVPPELVTSPTLVIAMAADAQVIRRAQRQSKFKEYVPLVAGTPYAMPFLKDMLADIFPEEFPRWEKEAGALDQSRQMLALMFEFVKKLPNPFDGAQPAQVQEGQKLFNQIGAFLSPNPDQKTPQ